MTKKTKQKEGDFTHEIEGEVVMGAILNRVGDSRSLAIYLSGDMMKGSGSGSGSTIFTMALPGKS